MSTRQKIVLACLGTAVVMVFGCLGVYLLTWLTGEAPPQVPKPLEQFDEAKKPPVASPTPYPAPTATQPSVSTLCQAETAEYLTEIQPSLEEFNDTVEVANSTARIALSPLVQDMQGIRRDIADVRGPDCARYASGLLVDGLDGIIRSFIDFMSEVPDATVERELNQGLLDMSNGLDQLVALASGEPTPLPRQLPTSTPVPTNTPSPTALPAGGTLVMGNWDIRVERIQIAETVSDGRHTARAIRRFALLFMAVTNRGLDPEAFFTDVGASSLMVQDAEGRLAFEDALATSYAWSQYNTGMGFEVNPGETAHTVKVFDISEQSSSYRLVSYAGSLLLDIP